MFKATIQDVSTIKDSLDAISSLITEGTFKVSKNGIELIAMDPASVAMVVFRLLPSAFLDYECEKDDLMTLNITNFVSVLKRARANDKIALELTENKLNIKMVGDFKRNFSLPLIDTPPQSQKIPELTFNTKIELFANVLQDGIKDASMISDCVVFEANSEKFTIKSFGDTSETKLELAKNSPSMVTMEYTSDSSSKYSIDYLDKILKAAKSSDKIKLNFSTDYPVKIECSKIDRYQVSFILAPRVDTD